MADIDNLIELYEQHKFMYGRFLDNVHSFFLHEPSLNQPPLPIIHSLKWRLKDPEHLRDKLQRKLERGDEINEQNLFEKSQILLVFEFFIYIRINLSIFILPL